jgi:hypothetical protein
MTDSSTGGYLVPASSPAPLQDQQLYEALQSMVVGVTGLDGTLVRPRWQPEPSLIPSAGTCWIAIGVTDREADVFPFLGFFPNDTTNYQMQRHEEFTMLASVYDLGYNGEADTVAVVLRDGIMIPQNNDMLAANGIYVVGDSDLAVAPSLFKQRWMYRVDLKIRFRRQITRQYSVDSIDTVGVDLYTDDGQPPRHIVPPGSVFVLDESALDSTNVLG